ncbi:hypothetical protein C1645_789424 [Glomus cerebriforme]|uniref:Alpha/Beta hydrolase protein n=1 Tax=Glomus cerebriforme TaxID=658196 RepID=A0A397SGG4_9GLOM|nr:hypothetical protein C1645_789424 [Glomus cerebriforme]
MGNSDKPTTNSHSIDLNTTIYMGNTDANPYSLDLKSADLFSLINKLSSEYDFKEKKIVLVGWSTGTPVSLNFMKNYPDIKIDGLVSVAGFVNNTGRELNEKVVSYFLNIVNPQDNFGEVISGLDEIYRSTSLHAFFLGNSVVAPYEYRTYTSYVDHCILWENIKEFNKDLINFVNKI